jgi:hypothetical protein
MIYTTGSHRIFIFIFIRLLGYSTSLWGKSHDADGQTDNDPDLVHSKNNAKHLAVPRFEKKYSCFKI